MHMRVRSDWRFGLRASRVGWVIVAAVVGTSPSVAAQRLPSVEVSAAFVPRLLPDGLGAAAQIGLHTGHGAEGPRWVFGLAYARELQSHGSCCGPSPGYSYQLETFEASAGVEVPLLTRTAWSLAIDGRANPLWYHSIRRGSQPDFDPPPSSWHSTMSVLSFGATVRALAAEQYQMSLRARTWVRFGGFPLGQVRSESSFGVGFGW
jgi:hypothetical protein